MRIKNLELAQKGKQIRLYFRNKSDSAGYYKEILDSTQTKNLYDSLVSLTDKTVEHDDKPYMDDISTYIDEVERTLDLSGHKGCLNFRLICYTDDDTDDNWIGLSPKRIAKLAGMIYPYI